jgi:hypothetical protein
MNKLKNVHHDSMTYIFNSQQTLCQIDNTHNLPFFLPTRAVPSSSWSPHNLFLTELVGQYIGKF